MFGQRHLKTKIGELLIQHNLITKQQLEKALKEQKKSGGYISQHLISMGFVNEKNVAECLVEQCREVLCCPEGAQLGREDQNI